MKYKNDNVTNSSSTSFIIQQKYDIPTLRLVLESVYKAHLLSIGDDPSKVSRMERDVLRIYGKSDRGFKTALREISGWLRSKREREKINIIIISVADNTIPYTMLQFLKASNIDGMHVHLG